MAGQNSNIEKYDSRLMKDYPFTILLNEVIQHINDLEIIGLYSYLASLPSEWVINKEHLKSHFEIGTKKIERLFRQLINLGLLIKEEYREKGRFVGVNYRLCLYSNRSAENGETVNGATEKRVHIKEIDKKENKHIKITPLKKAKLSLVSQKMEILNQDLIEAFINEFPEHPHPNPKKINKELVGALNLLKRAWPSDISPSGKELTVETWVQYLKNLKEVNHWMTNPEKNVSMITFCRIKTVQEAISIFNAYERRKNKEKYV